LTVFNNIIGINSCLFRAGWDTYPTAGADPLNYPVFDGNIVYWTGEFANSAGVAFGPVHYISSVFIFENGPVRTYFGTYTTGYTAEGLAINETDSTSRALFNALPAAFTFFGC
jgi:hypothetical protein